MLSNWRSQFLFDRLGRCLKLLIHNAYICQKPSSGEKPKKPPQFNDWTSADSADMYRQETTAFTAMQSFLTLSAQLTPKQRFDAGHHLNTMLLTCTWGGMTCSPKSVSMSPKLQITRQVIRATLSLLVQRPKPNK